MTEKQRGELLIAICNGHEVEPAQEIDRALRQKGVQKWEVQAVAAAKDPRPLWKFLNFLGPDS